MRCAVRKAFPWALFFLALSITGYGQTCTPEAPRFGPVDSPASIYGPAGGGNILFVRFAAPNCPFTIAADAPWIMLSGGGNSGTTFIGLGLSVAAIVAPNPDAIPRHGNVTVTEGGVVIRSYSFAVNSTSCTYSVTPSTVHLGQAGGSGTLSVTPTPNDCVPFPVGGTPGISVMLQGGAYGYTVGPNAGAARSGTTTFGYYNGAASGPNSTFTVTQDARDGSSGGAFGSLTHVAAEGGWNTRTILVNNSSAPARAHLDFFGDSGGPLLLPFAFISSGTAGVASSLDQTLSPNALFIADSTGPASTLTGSAQLRADAGIGGFGIFSFPANRWEALVPFESRNADRYILAFDNTGALATGVAIANIATEQAIVGFLIRDDGGHVIGGGGFTIPALGHTSYVLSQQYQSLAGRRGTIEFSPPENGEITVLGLRANGAALTTLPVLTNLDTGGGSIAHVAFDGGFTSTYYLVNTDVGKSSFTLSFVDENGNPLQVPLSLPQSGTTETTSAFTGSLTGGAMLEIDIMAQDTLPLVVGSAQLTTTSAALTPGRISGFEVFRWTTYGQEASVPLETRNAGSFVLVFDNTNGLTTGVALSNSAAPPAAVTVNLRDETGALMQSVVVNLAAHGHTSFTLPETYAVSAGKRGTIEFMTPPGGPISVIGLLATNDGTLTTIPVLAK